MKITYRVNEADYRDAYKLFVAHEPGMRRASRRVLPVLGVFAILLPIVSLSMAPHNSPGLAVITILFGLYMLYCGFALKLYFRKLYRGDRRLQQDSIAEIGEDGVHFITPDADTQMTWAAFIRILESDRVFLLFRSQWLFTVLPKSAFGPGEASAFRELAARKIAVRS